MNALAPAPTGTRVWVQDSPLGALRVAVGEAGLRSIDFGGGRGEPSGPPEATVAAALAAYFAGDLSAVEALPVDLGGRTPFTKTVLGALRRVGPGQLTTYGGLAATVGRPGASRAVGRVMGANPLPIVIPCHRVLAGGGSLGGYSGGLDVKGWLLAHEGHDEWAPARRGQARAGSAASIPNRRR